MCLHGNKLEKVSQTRASDQLSCTVIRVHCSNQSVLLIMSPTAIRVSPFAHISPGVRLIKRKPYVWMWLQALWNFSSAEPLEILRLGGIQYKSEIFSLLSMSIHESPLGILDLNFPLP